WHGAILVWRLRNLWQRLRTMPRHHPAQTTERVYELRCVRILPRQTIERFERRVVLRRDDEHLDAVGERCRPLQCFDEMRRRARGLEQRRGGVTDGIAQRGTSALDMHNGHAHSGK